MYIVHIVILGNRHTCVIKLVDGMDCEGTIHERIIDAPKKKKFPIMQ